MRKNNLPRILYVSVLFIVLMVDCKSKPKEPPMFVTLDNSIATSDQLPGNCLRVDIASAHCARVSKVLLLRNEYTDVPTVPTRCGPTSIVVDPMYEIIHWTPELRRAFATPPSQ